MNLILISIFAALGALSRYSMGYAIQRYFPYFPMGTLVINVAGSFLLALFLSVSINRLVIPPQWRTAVTIGFFGSFTTFSTFSYESYTMLAEGEHLRALAYIITSVVLGIGSAFLGFRIGEIL